MSKPTRNSLKKEDITIDRVRKRLSDVARLINTNNKQNLTDINVICEEIFGVILNRLYNLELVSLSAEKYGNYIAVDLIDEKNKIAYQVTSRFHREKITDTISKFNKDHGKMGQIDKLYFLILSDKEHTYRTTDTVSLYNGNTFSFTNDIINFNDLISEIENKSINNPELIIKIYEDISMIYDTGRLERPDIVRETKELSLQSHINSKFHEHWKKGYGDVVLYGFLPVVYTDEISCMLETRKHDVSGVYLTIGQERLLDDYFVDEEAFIRKHHVGRDEDEDEICIQIENARFSINAYTAYHIFMLFKDFQHKYEEKKIQIANSMGTSGFSRRGRSYLISQIDQAQRDEIIIFAKDHSYSKDDGDNEWNIFDSIPWNNTIQLYTNMQSGESVYNLANIKVRQQEYHVDKYDVDKYDVLWEPGSKEGIVGLEGFDNGLIWKADYTKKWFEEELLPMAHIYSCKQSKKRFLGFFSNRKPT